MDTTLSAKDKMAESCQSASAKKPTDSPRYLAIMESLLNFASLSRLLRLLGAGIVCAALGVFLLQGWQNGDDIERYLLLLTQTGFLAAIGFICSHWLNEPKSARVFIGLALIAVPVNFAILGGLLYAQFPWDSMVGNYPTYAHWYSSSANKVLLTCLGGLIALLPIIAIGFMVMARRSAKVLSGLFLLANALLLIPIRTPEYIAIGLTVMVGFMAWQLRFIGREDTTLTTGEGRFARVVQFIPLLLMALRSLIFYPVDLILYAAAALALLLVCRQIALSMKAVNPWRKTLEHFSLIPAAASAFYITALVDTWFQHSDSWLLPCFALMFASFVFELSLRSVANGARLRRWASLVVMGCTGINLLLQPGLDTAMICLISGLALIIYGFSAEQRAIFVHGLITLLMGLAYHLNMVYEHFNLGSWSSLAILGVSAILAASLLERYGLILKTRFSNWLKQYRGWER